MMNNADINETALWRKLEWEIESETSCQKKKKKKPQSPSATWRVPSAVKAILDPMHTLSSS